MYCTVLCLALLPFPFSLLIGKNRCNSFLIFFNILYICFLVFYVVFYFEYSMFWYCFFFCIRLSLSHLCKNLPTTSKWWKPNCSKSYHKNVSFSQFIALHFFTSHRPITFCVQSVQNKTNFPHPQPCNPNRLGGLQLGPCLSLDNSRQFSYLYRHTRDHILSV